MENKSISVNIQSEGKNMVIAYVLWWFLGWAGIHRFYLGKMKTGVAQLVLQVVGWVTSVFIIGFLFLAIWFVWWLVDAFLVYKIVSETNEELGLNASGFVLNTSSQSNNNLDQIEKLHALYEKGALTKEQYESKKSELL